ncbi:enoyl-CoA hydratase/isomerase family protein [Pseudoduganella sp. GCM10020061]|uniref:enoyl-CoA hydratase/isomerase family protein n=1 Tax=Pseudoduganella sp. GCM10020061 TaxID=3317345 RepID=UPI00362F5F23
MTEYVQTRVSNGIGFITLDRPKALNSLSLDMVRALTDVLLQWQADPGVQAVVLGSSSEKALCAGGDIRFFFEAGKATPMGGSALLEDFFTEEYALNHLIHYYEKPYVALMDGVVMGGGMGIAQAGPQARVRVVTERTKMAMPEVNIGLFPDVGGSYFLSRAAGALGNYLGLTGLTVGAADSIYLDLADVFVPGERMAELKAALAAADGSRVREVIASFGAAAGASQLEAERATIDRHFSLASVQAIMDSLEQDASPFAQKALGAMRQRSPLMMRVTFELLKRGASLDVADCLRMERNLVRRNFEHGEVLEGVRALVIDKDNQPVWNPPSLDSVTDEMVDRFFEPAWPTWAHPLRHL